MKACYRAKNEAGAEKGYLVMLLGVLVVALVLTLAPAQPVAAGCGSWGTVTNVSPYPNGGGYWVAVHVTPGTPRGYWTSFRTVRMFAVDSSAYVVGCPDATRYVEQPLVWR
jgi:hypothetical protein